LHTSVAQLNTVCAETTTTVFKQDLVQVQGTGKRCHIWKHCFAKTSLPTGRMFEWHEDVPIYLCKNKIA